MVMAEMSKAEVARFLKQGTFTGKLATVIEEQSHDSMYETATPQETEDTRRLK